MFVCDLDPFYYHELDEISKAKKWHIEDAECKNGYVKQVKMKIWKDEPIIPKKTFEVLNDTGIHSYNISANSFYQRAMEAKNEVVNSSGFDNVIQLGTTKTRDPIEDYNYMNDSKPPK